MKRLKKPSKTMVNGMDDLEYNLISETDKANICALIKKKLAE